MRGNVQLNSKGIRGGFSMEIRGRTTVANFGTTLRSFRRPGLGGSRRRGLAGAPGAVRIKFLVLRRSIYISFHNGSIAIFWTRNYSSCHGSSFVDGVFIPLGVAPITSRENCLSLQPMGGGETHKTKTGNLRYFHSHHNLRSPVRKI